MSYQFAAIDPTHDDRLRLACRSARHWKLAITALGLHDTVIAVDDRTIDIEAATAAGIEGACCPLHPFKHHHQTARAAQPAVEMP